MSATSSFMSRVVGASPDDSDGSDAEFSFDGKNLKPGKSDKYGRPVPSEARLVAPPATRDVDYVYPVTSSEPRTTQSTSGSNGGLGPIHVRVTPYQPKSSDALTRERSLRALEGAREQREREAGEQSRLIREQTYGYLLPRDQVVGSDSDPGQSRVRVHYIRSVQVVEELREERMMRFFSGGKQ